MPPRFYAPDLDPTRGEVTLSEEESRHLDRVLRLRQGAHVSVFDGHGREYGALVADIGSRAVRLRLSEEIQPALEPSVKLTLAHGILKGTKQDDLIRDATMLGVGAVQPLWSARTDVRRRGFRQGHAVERWRRIAVASCKQSGRAVVPVVHAPIDFQSFVASDRSRLRLLLVEPGAASEALPLAALAARPRPETALALVGPEGGWSPEEIAEAVARGIQPVRLGGRTLRADAVPLVALALLLFVWGEL